jgi:4-hydroxybenzoate polyprenyltransferase
MNPAIRLMRLDRPVGIYLLFWPCVWGLSLGAGKIISLTFLHDLLLFFVGAVVMRSAGCIINDIWDRRLDAAVARTRNRPLASGEMRLRTALGLLVCLLLIALVIWLQLNLQTKFLSLIALGLAVAYPLMKRITWWPQAFLGVTFNFGILMGYAAQVNAISPAILVLYLGAVFWTLGYDTIYAHQDIEDDQRIGIKSTALRFAAHPKKFVALCYALAVLLWWCAAMLQAFPWWGYAMLLGAGLHLLRQLTLWQPTDAANSLKVFKSNVETAMLMAGMCLAIAL